MTVATAVAMAVVLVAGSGSIQFMLAEVPFNICYLL